jgi:di/tricarboxylate transporter
MTTLYGIFVVFGLLIFVIAIFADVSHDIDFGHHDFDFGHHDLDSSHTDSPGLFSIRTISAFLAGFGVSGLLAKLVLDWGVGGQLFLGFATGLALAAMVYLIIRLFYSQQAGGVKDASELVGKSAVITIGTGSQNIGECRVDNLYYTFREKNGKKLNPNEVAKVTEAEPGLLIVEKL